VAVAVIILGLVLYVPALQSLFKFGVLSLTDVLLCFLAGSVSVLWFEALKTTKFSLKPARGKDEGSE
jgi:Ca2+-transporting ATPase